MKGDQRNCMPEPPITRPHKDEIHAYVTLICSLSALLEQTDVLERRLKTIPNAWRDYKCATSILTKLSNALIRTFTPEKRKTIQGMIPDLRYQIKYHKRVGRQEDAISAIYASDLDLISSVAIEYYCKLCDGLCDRCDLGKVFDSMLNLERDDGESYAFVKTDLNGFDHVRFGGQRGKDE